MLSLSVGSSVIPCTALMLSLHEIFDLLYLVACEVVSCRSADRTLSFHHVVDGRPVDRQSLDVSLLEICD